MICLAFLKETPWIVPRLEAVYLLKPAGRWESRSERKGLRDLLLFWENKDTSTWTAECVTAKKKKKNESNRRQIKQPPPPPHLKPKVGFTHLKVVQLFLKNTYSRWCSCVFPSTALRTGISSGWLSTATLSTSSWVIPTCSQAASGFSWHLSHTNNVMKYLWAAVCICP